MAPAEVNHGLIQSEVCFLIRLHLRDIGSHCRIVTTPGVIPRVESIHNERVPDLGVTCSPQQDGKAITDPVLLIEVISPSNEADTRRNVWAYTSIPSVVEILLLSSTSMSGELLRRGADGAWPSDPMRLAAGSLVRLDAIGFTASLREFYATSSLGA